MNTNPVVTQFTGDAAPFLKELKKVSSGLVGFRGDVSEIANTVGNLAKGFLGFEAIKKTISAVIEATAKQQAAQAQLNAALISAGAPVKAASAEYQAYASQLERTTTFSTEAVEQVETLLLSFQGLSGQTVKDATASVLDLSTRMGIDAPAAAKLLGKALSDPADSLSALTKAGYIFTAGQKDQIKAMQEAGNVAGAQQIILKSLEDRFGGAAAAARDTFGGALAGLKNAFGDLLVGDTGFDGVADSINDLTAVLSSPEIKEGFGIIISGIAEVIKLAAEAVTGIANFTHAVTENIAEHVAGPGGASTAELKKKIADIHSAQKQIKADYEDGTTAEKAYDDQALKGYDAQLIALNKLLDLRKEYGDFTPEAPKSAPAAMKFTTGGAAAAAAKAAAEKQAKENAAAGAAFVAAMSGAAEKQANESAVESANLLGEQGKFESDLNAQVLQAGDDLNKQMVAQSLSALDDQYADMQLNANQRIKLERQTQAQIRGFIADGLNAAVSLHTSSDKKVRAIAKAAFAIQKAQAIAETAINTEQAVMKTYAKLGYPWGIPAAIAVAALGAVQVAAIASQKIDGGYGGGGDSGAGGASLGTPNNPVYNQDNSQQQYGVTPQTVVQVHVEGYISQAVVDDMLEQLTDYFDRDGVVISPTSRQALDIKGS